MTDNEYIVTHLHYDPVTGILSWLPGTYGYRRCIAATAPPSLVTAPPSKTVDTSGRNKTLLGV